MNFLNWPLWHRSQTSESDVTLVPGVRLYQFPWTRIVLGSAIITATGFLAITSGPADIPIYTVLKILVNKIPFVTTGNTWAETWDTIVWQVRFPRVAVAALVGMALSLSGATYQGLFRNPLADPYLIGVAAGAGLGATILMTSPAPAYIGSFSLVPIAAFLTAILTVTLTYYLARSGGSVPTTTLILAGVALASLASAITAFLLMTSSQDARPVLYWLLGSFANASWIQVFVLAPYFIIGACVIIAHGRILNVIQLDEEQARQLGVSVERTKLVLIIASSLLVAAAVSTSGLIGFVGLIAPHTVRLLWGHDYRSLLPTAMVTGGIVLILADLLARLVLSPAEIPVGVVTAFFGAPFFLWILRQRKHTIF